MTSICVRCNYKIMVCTRLCSSRCLPSVGDTLANPSSFFRIDHHTDDAPPESGSRFGNRAHCAFSSAVSGNVRMVEEIHQFGIISQIPLVTVRGLSVSERVD